MLGLTDRVGSAVTVTVAEPRTPLFAVAKIVVDPTARPVTTPFALTVATFVLFDDQVTLLFVAFHGVTVADKACVALTFIVALAGETDTPVTGMFTLVPVVNDKIQG